MEAIPLEYGARSAVTSAATQRNYESIPYCDINVDRWLELNAPLGSREPQVYYPKIVQQERTAQKVMPPQVGQMVCQQQLQTKTSASKNVEQSVADIEAALRKSGKEKLATASLLANDDSTVDDQRWLRRLHTIHAYAIRRIVDSEMPSIKRSFMRNAKYGACCFALLRIRDYRLETITHLQRLGFSFMPVVETRMKNGRYAYYEVSLPLSCDNDAKMSEWVRQVRQVYSVAQSRLANRQCKYIQKKFETAAKERRELTVTLHQNYCTWQTFDALRERFGCRLVKSDNDSITLRIDE